MNEDEQAGAEPSAAANVEPREAGAQGSLQVKRGSGGGWEVKQVVLVGATAATVVVSLLVFSVRHRCSRAPDWGRDSWRSEL